MRELILNDASIAAADQSTAIDWLADIAKGMSSLVNNKVVQNTLRTSCPLQEIYYRDNSSFWDAIIALRQRGLVEEYRFLVRSSVKSPLIKELEQSIKDRFLACEGQTSLSLVLCSISDGIAVSFPSDSVWDRDLIRVDFYELKGDGSGEVNEEKTFEEIDNIARSNHAPPICERHRQSLRDQIKSTEELWNNREQAFPNLLFGPDVEDHLAKLNAGNLGTIVGKLASLNAAVTEWRCVGSSVPQWKTKTTDESESLRNDNKKREKRRFRSHDGTKQLFLWHARFGDSGRIHLRFDPSSREVEIGYIGPHL